MNKLTKYMTIGVVVLALLVLTTTVALANETLTIPLQNNTAGPGSDCPLYGGPSWHFVISPNNNHSFFITFHLNLGDTTTYNTSIFVPNGTQLDNVFVAVPAGKTITSLQTAGSSADISWDGIGDTPDKFQLSHVCLGASNLTLSKTVDTTTYKRTFDWTIDKSADVDTVYSVGGGESDPVTFTVAVTKDAGTDSDWTVSGTITVHNPNSFAVNGVTITDSGCSVTPSTVNVAAGGSTTVAYVCQPGSGAGGTNYATATWPPIGSPNTSAAGSAAYSFGDPILVNDTVHVIDSNGKAWDFSDSGSETYQMTYTDPAGICTSHENTATIEGLDKSDSVTVKDCQGADLSVTKTVDTATFKRTFDWTIDKSADPLTVYSAGGGISDPVTFTVAVTKDDGIDSDWIMSGKITVANPNAWEAVTVDVTDAVDNGGTCTVINGTGVSIPAGDSKTFNYSCSYDSMPLSYSGTNTATATWDAATYHTPNGSASGTAGFAFTEIPVNDSVHVIDSNGQEWDFSATGSATYQMTYQDLAGTCTSHENTATIEVLNKSDSVTVKDCQGADLIVKKTAIPSYDLTYTWDITKIALDPTSLEVDKGMPADFNFQVTVTHDSGTQSNWMVSGVITITNPNDWEDIDVSVNEVLPGCWSIMLFDPITVPAGKSVEVPYSCPVDSAAPGTNTVDITWDKDLYHTPTGTASGSADYVFGDPTNVVDECVDVNDSNIGFLGTVCVGEGNPKVFLYSATYYGPAAGSCVNYNNTATFTTNDTGATGSDSATVEVCSYNARLTPGYWKNHLVYDSKNPQNPWVKEYLPQTLGSYSVTLTSQATAVFNAMNCSSTKDQDAVGCLAGHLLAAKLNVANGANPSIASTITAADNFLKGINYIGPNSKYTLTAAQRTYIISLKTALDKYNSGK